MIHLKFISDGTRNGTSLVDKNSQEVVSGIVSATLEDSVGKTKVLKLELNNLELDINTSDFRYQTQAEKPISEFKDRHDVTGVTAITVTVDAHGMETKYTVHNGNDVEYYNRWITKPVVIEEFFGEEPINICNKAAEKDIVSGLSKLNEKELDALGLTQKSLLYRINGKLDVKPKLGKEVFIASNQNAKPCRRQKC